LAQHRSPSATTRVPPAATTVGCTDVWVGPRRGGWSSATNWSSGAVPDERSHACLPRGVTAVVANGRYRVGAVEAGGAITIRNGALLVMGTSIASEVADVELSHGALGGPGKLIVTRRLRWGRAGAMLGAGDTVIGLAAHGVIAAGTGSQSARIGGADGTGPHPQDSRNAPAPACNRYSPPWAEHCATRHYADAAAIRALWSRFAPLVNALPTDLGQIVALLAPGTCASLADHGSVQRRGDCRHVARTVIDAAGEHALRRELGDVYVEGDEAVARTNTPGSSIRFARVDGQWLIREI
jgi:hypothetical protein